MFDTILSLFGCGRPELPSPVTITVLRIPADGSPSHLVSLQTTHEGVSEGVGHHLHHIPDVRPFWKVPRAWRYRDIGHLEFSDQQQRACNGSYMVLYSFALDDLPQNTHSPAFILRSIGNSWGDVFVVKMMPNEWEEHGWACYDDVPEQFFDLPVMARMGKGPLLVQSKDDDLLPNKDSLTVRETFLSFFGYGPFHPPAVAIKVLRIPADGSPSHILSLHTTHEGVANGVGRDLYHLPDLRPFWKIPQAWEYRDIHRMEISNNSLNQSSNGVYIVLFSFALDDLPQNMNVPGFIVQRIGNSWGDVFVAKLMPQEWDEHGWASYDDVSEQFLKLPSMQGPRYHARGRRGDSDMPFSDQAELDLLFRQNGL
ncbi:hypothetical protein HWV62_32766 [Athelia sp. TMB]|nr:hypothetical protein HWV62_32766 [Athelia sp. TMB]